MPRWPLASSAPRLRAPGPGRPFLPRTDHIHSSRVLPHQVQRRPTSYARTPHNTPPRRQTAITACTGNIFPVRTMRVSLVNTQARTIWMNPSSAQVLGEFLRRYPPEAPSIPSDAPPQDFQLTPKHGLRILSPAPATDILAGAPPTSRFNSKCRYLWVIDQRGIPHIIEECLDILNKTLPKHTNLTGGGNACMGGEMWFASNSSLYVSGGSGRYPAADSQQLNAAVEVFESLGYKVMSLGWDEVAGFPKRHWEGGP